MTLPTFLIVGAAKSGTTSLATYLQQHPDVFLSRPKEPNYFALADVALPMKGPAPSEVLQGTLYSASRTTWPEYGRLFERATGYQAIGEASVRYLYFDRAPKRIREALPRVRLVAMLRDPVSRLYSHYNMNRQFMLEPLDLADAVAAEERRVAEGWGWDWHYVRLGFYAKQLARYFKYFEKQQIAVFFYDDFVRDPAGVYAAVCRHIGISDHFVPDMSRRGMVSSRPRSSVLARWLLWPNKFRGRLVRYGGPLGRPLVDQLKRWNALPVPKLDEGRRKALRSLFDEDTRALGLLLEREIPW